MLATTADESFFDDPSLGNAGKPCHVQVAVDWFGPTDFLTMDEQLAQNGLGPADHGGAASPESLYLGVTIAEDPHRARQACPIAYIGEGMAPILIQHGRADDIVPFQQSVDFARAIAERVGAERFELDLLDGAGHVDPLFDTAQNLDRVFAFIERRL